MIKNISKVILTGGLILSLILTAVACGSNAKKTDSSTSSATTAANTVQSTTPVKKEPVKMTMSTFNGWTSDGALKAGIDKANELTGNTVELQIYPDDQYFTLIKTKIAVNDVPDIINCYVGAYSEILPVDSMEPLDGPWISMIPEHDLKYIFSGKDGKVYNAPRGATNSFGYIYNKEIFEKAGIKVPFKNYDELTAAFETIKKAGVIPLALANKEEWNSQLIYQMGGTFLASKIPDKWEAIETNKTKMGDVPEIVQLFERMLSLKDKGYINPDFMSTTIDMAQKYVVEGKAAGFLDGTWDYSNLKKNYPDKVDNLGFTQFSLGDAGDPLIIHRGSSGDGFWVPKDAKNKDAAKEYVNVMVSEPVMQVMYEIAPGMPEYNGMKLAGSPWIDEVLGLINEYKNVNAGWNDVPELSTIGFDWAKTGTVSQVIFSGKSIEKTMADYYDEYSKANKAKKVPGF